MLTKKCYKCQEVKPLDEYHKKKDAKDGYKNECKKCVSEKMKEHYLENKEKLSEQKKEYYLENKDKVLEQRKEYYYENRDKKLEYIKEYDSRPENKERRKCRDLQRRYGITLDEYNEMLEEQQYRCAICLIHQDELSKALAVDHSHKTGKVRGLLCNACNVSLGKLNDSPTTFRRAAEYLEEHENK